MLTSDDEGIPTMQNTICKTQSRDSSYRSNVSIDNTMYLVEFQQHPEDYRSCSDNVKYVKGNIMK